MVRFAVIPGDGISPEIMPEAIISLDTAHELYEFALDYETYDFGVEHYFKTGQVVPDDIDCVAIRENTEGYEHGTGGNFKVSTHLTRRVSFT